MTAIQVDGYVRVPRGTVVYPIGDGVPALSGRDQVVRVKRIFDVDVKSDNFYLLLPDGLRSRYFEMRGPIAPDILEFTDRLTKGDYRAVEWSSKWALIAEVQPTEAPAGAKKTRKTEERPLTKQDLMVRGSVWRFTQDAELRYKVRNPAYAPMRDDILYGLRQLPSHARTQALEAKLNELGVSDHLDEPWGPVRAGETFTVINKLTKGYAGGLDVPTLFRGERFTLPYSSLEPVIELVSAS
jgi:hypothetical protein